MRPRIKVIDPLEMLTKQELAEKLHVSTWTIMRWAQETDFPKPIRLSEQTLVWRRRDVESWLEERERPGAPMRQDPTWLHEDREANDDGC